MKFRFSSQPGRQIGDDFDTQVVVTKHAGKIVMAVFIAVFLIFAGVGWALWTFGGRDAALMAEGAVQVVARVDMLEVERRTSQGDTGSKTTYSYYAGVVFDDKDGREQRARLQIGQGDYNRLREGDDLPLRYAAADASVVELRAGDLASGAAFGYWIMMGGLAGVGVTLVVGFVRRRRVEVI